ncbi:hypothetical protein [Frankia sp. QA3]|nr:hypothetical protein [Frankia sp. QA3]
MSSKLLFPAGWQAPVTGGGATRRAGGRAGGVGRPREQARRRVDGHP